MLPQNSMNSSSQPNSQASQQVIVSFPSGDPTWHYGRRPSSSSESEQSRLPTFSSMKERLNHFEDHVLCAEPKMQQRIVDYHVKAAQDREESKIVLLFSRNDYVLLRQRSQGGSTNLPIQTNHISWSPNDTFLRLCIYLRRSATELQDVNGILQCVVCHLAQTAHRKDSRICQVLCAFTETGPQNVEPHVGVICGSCASRVGPNPLQTNTEVLQTGHCSMTWMLTPQEKRDRLDEIVAKQSKQNEKEEIKKGRRRNRRRRGNS